MGLEITYEVTVEANYYCSKFWWPEDPGAAVLWPAFATYGFSTGWASSHPVFGYCSQDLGRIHLLCFYLSSSPSLVFLPFPKDGYFLYMKSKCPAERGDPAPFPAALTPHYHCHWVLPSLLILKQFFLAMESPEEILCAPRGEGSRQRFSHSCISLMPQTSHPQQTPK